MTLQWAGKYTFEPGDIVEVIGDNHPLKGIRGIIETAFSTEQFGVILPPFFKGISLWAEDLKLIQTHRPVEIPKIFIEAFEERK